MNGLTEMPSQQADISSFPSMKTVTHCLAALQRVPPVKEPLNTQSLPRNLCLTLNHEQPETFEEITNRKVRDQSKQTKDLKNKTYKKADERKLGGNRECRNQK